MKLGIITANLDGNRSGIGTYIYNLIDQLKPRHEITLIRHENGINIPGCESIVIRNKIKKGYNSLLWSQCLRWHWKELQNFDLIHNPGQFLTLPIRRVNSVVTVHDITPVLYPEYHFPFRNWSNRVFLSSILKTSTAIISDSYHTKRDICAYYHLQPELIHVVHLAADSCYKPLPYDAVKEWKKTKGIINPYILFVGTIEPRKNIDTVLQAFALVRNEYPNLELVIAGNIGWNAEPILMAMKNPKMSKNIRYLQYLPHEELPYLYNGALGLVYPSWYEGFGLPPLEAMQCGVPVISSNTSSLPEVIGSGGILINPADIHGFAEAIDRLCSDEMFRENQKAYGIKRAELFSWEKTAMETVRVYETLMSE